MKAETSWDRARRWYKEGLWPVDVLRNNPKSLGLMGDSC